MDLMKHIRTVPDFPKPGINFYDIATLLVDPSAWKETVSQMHDLVAPYKPDRLMGIESRGFLMAAPLALYLDCGFGMIRKKGKLPGETLTFEYDLEYGSDTIEIQPDLIEAGTRVVIIDDILATGGTMHAAETMLAQAGVEVAASACLLELEGLGGRDKLKAPFETLLKAPA